MWRSWRLASVGRVAHVGIDLLDHRAEAALVTGIDADVGHAEIERAAHGPIDLGLVGRADLEMELQARATRGAARNASRSAEVIRPTADLPPSLRWRQSPVRPCTYAKSAGRAWSSCRSPDCGSACSCARRTAPARCARGCGGRARIERRKRRCIAVTGIEERAEPGIGTHADASLRQPEERIRAAVNRSRHAVTSRGSGSMVTCGPAFAGMLPRAARSPAP